MIKFKPRRIDIKIIIIILSRLISFNMLRYITTALLLIIPFSSVKSEKNTIIEQIKKASGITENDCTAAAEKKTVGLFDLYALAVKNGGKVAISGEKLKQSEARKREAFSAFLPRISLRASSEIPGKNEKNGFKNSVYLYGRQPLLTGLDEWSAFRESKYDVALNASALSYSAALLLYDTSYGYYNILRIEKNLESSSEILKLYVKNIEELERRARLGKNRRSDVLTAASEMHKLEAEIVSLSNEIERARLYISSLCGINLGDKILADDVALGRPPDIDPDIEKLIESRWDVRIAFENIRIAEARLLAVKGGFLPSLYVEGIYRLYQSPAAPSDYNVLFGAELPVFSGGNTLAKISEAESKLSQAGLELKEARRNAKQNIIDSYQTLKNSEKEVEAYRKSFKWAEDNYRTTLNDYYLNLVTILDVTTSLKSLQSAKNDYERVALQNKFNRIILAISTNEITGDKIKKIKSVSQSEDGGKR